MLKKIKIGFIYDFNFNQLDNYSKKKIDLLNSKITRLGVRIDNIKVPEFDEINNFFHIHGSLVNYEAWRYWKGIIEYNLKFIDPNVADRFLIGKNMTYESINKIKKKVKNLKKNVLKMFDSYDFFLMPTIALGPPTIKDLRNKKKYHFYNNAALDNTRGVNIFDLCAISLPLKLDKRRWLSLSIITNRNNDNKLLAVAEKIESIL